MASGLSMSIIMGNLVYVKCGNKLTARWIVLIIGHTDKGQTWEYVEFTGQSVVYRRSLKFITKQPQILKP